MPNVSNYTRQRIESLHKQNLPPAAIFKQLKREELEVRFSSVTRIIKKYKITGSMKKGASTGRRTKLNPESQQFIEEQMRNDDAERRCRKKFGWTLQQTRYCQLIRDANKVKRLEYAQRVLETGDTFDNVIFSDECSISLEQFRQTCYRKVGEPAKRKAKPKHPLKVHVWAGISRHGATKICIFEGIMLADLYCDILRSNLIPFINEKLPNHRFMQDNDPKHTSRVAKTFFEDNRINWKKRTPDRRLDQIIPHECTVMSQSVQKQNLAILCFCFSTVAEPCYGSSPVCGFSQS